MQYIKLLLSNLRPSFNQEHLKHLPCEYIQNLYLFISHVSLRNNVKLIAPKVSALYLTKKGRPTNAVSHHIDPELCHCSFIPQDWMLHQSQEHIGSLENLCSSIHIRNSEKLIGRKWCPQWAPSPVNKEIISNSNRIQCLPAGMLAI